MPGNTHNQQSDNISRLQHKIKELEGKLLDYTQMEQQMEEGEHRFRQILSLTYDGIIIYEKDTGKILEVNQRLVHKLQYLLKDVIGNSVLQFVTPEQRDILTKRLKEDLPDVYEAVFVGKDNVRHEFEICSRSCMYRGQKVKMAAVSDVSYKKYYEKILRESEERFRSLSENTDDSIILVNGPDIIYANPSTFRVFDIKINELSGLSQVLANVHAEDINCFSALIKDIISGKRQSQACRFRILSDDNKVRWIWSRVFPVVPDTNDTRLV
ncbi:MAG: PAS domain-containing protein, partial [Bacteroidales bacterium]|nr:PAS domain-containing protein [Bacteroidales bacterium]